jgi:hypothetical protein
MVARPPKTERTANAPSLKPGKQPESALRDKLLEYQTQNGLNGKGQIATMLFASRLARKSGLPFDIDAGLITEGEGQIKGLSKGAVQAILADYGITRVLAEEGGRTSRGSLGNIRSFLVFLNRLHAMRALNASAVEAWWVHQAQQFFNAKPFTLHFEAGKSLRSVIRDLLGQAKKRQDQGTGTMFVGAMLQHLIGAKLALALPDVQIAHHGFAVADAPGGRSGDFEIANSSLHVTMTPGEAVMRKCAANLAAGRQPIVITRFEMLAAADAFAQAQGVAEQLDILDAEQFLVANLYELGGFRSDRQRVTVESLIDRYNEIVRAHETDPSLKISRG